MSETQHTPGPWELQANGACWNLRSPDRTDHFCILIGMVHNNPGEHEANARLIAAAPELLAALQALVDAFYPSAVFEFEARDNARAAIAKHKDQVLGDAEQKGGGA